jgi:hypothetical protein
MHPLGARLNGERTVLFKDQAQLVVARWECLGNDDDIETVAVQTAVALSRVPDVPEYVLKALDGLLDFDNEKRGRRIYDVVRYLRGLTEESHQLESEKKAS